MSMETQGHQASDTAEGDDLDELDFEGDDDAEDEVSVSANAANAEGADTEAGLHSAEPPAQVS